MSSSLESLISAAREGVAVTYGLSATGASYAAAQLEKSQSTGLVVVTSSDQLSRDLRDDLRLFLPQRPDDGLPGAGASAEWIPAPATSPYSELSADRSVQLARMIALYRLAVGGPRPPRAYVLSAESLSRKVLPKEALVNMCFTIDRAAFFDRDQVVRKLLAAGYCRSPIVEDPGTFAVRGGVLDLFAPLYNFPIRIELWGDEIESIRAFDPTSQRTLRDLERIDVQPARETIATDKAEVRKRILEAADHAAHPSKATRHILEQVESNEEFVGIETLLPAFHQGLVPIHSYVPESFHWLIIDPDQIARQLSDEREQAADRYQQRLADHRIAFAPGELWISESQQQEPLTRPQRMEARTLEVHGQSDGALHFSEDPTRPLQAELQSARRQRMERILDPLVNRLEAWRDDGWSVAIATSDKARCERLTALLSEYEIECQHDSVDDRPLVPGGPPRIVRGHLSAGFALAEDRLAWISDDDIFGPKRASGKRQKHAAKRAREALLGGVADFSQLNADDFLIHTVHGIGQYKGLAKLPVAGTAIDFLHIAYEGGQLYLPVYRLDEVQRYVGADGKTPKIDKLGGVTWTKTKSKAARDIRALAEELLVLYAQRASLPGRAFPPGDAMYGDFEASFEFEETPDQQAAIDAVLADMEQPRPMDRLVCGDVGYGKTEVALRAILKAVLGGAQAAFLAPTTVLVEQHYRTMSNRFAGMPINVARLSRFQSRKQITETLQALAGGRIDAVVGTHRLLSNDVRFADLGLIVIDEEQRFGVAHKERLKRMRTQIDVLTLTATPIPRTLHLSMTGMRDLSIIATPPADRRSIRTLVARPEDGVLREGLGRELARGGQVFFVVPRIRSQLGDHRDRNLDGWAEHLRSLFPTARVAVAHGQMASTNLEKVMIDFVDGKHDILVCTTIVESGLDIAKANTMFVARADRLGLAQMYQLRGRIGRSHERAFCYLLLPEGESPITDQARRRLQALQRYSDLGAGFLIASHDLEIRGAGELFGKKQSGSIAAVGFEAYTSLLEEAVAELRGQHIDRPLDPELNVEVPGFIPDDYVHDTGQRLDLYKRLSSAKDSEEVADLVAEMTDRYGQVPDETLVLADLMVIKAFARQLRAISVELTGVRLSLALGPDTPLDATVISKLVADRSSRYRLTPDMRLTCAFDDGERENPALAARETLAALCKTALSATSHN